MACCNNSTVCVKNLVVSLDIQTDRGSKYTLRSNWEYSRGSSSTAVDSDAETGCLLTICGKYVCML
jgi:hypothetical protein